MPSTLPPLAAIEAFVFTVRHGSFSDAARRLGVSRAAVSKQVQRLEQHANIRLLHRSTRHLHPTEEGQGLYQRLSDGLGTLDAAFLWLDEHRQQPSGLLRISLPIGFGNHRILPLMPEFLRRYPHVVPELFFDDHTLDPIAEGFDVGIRGGNLPDSSLISRKLAPMEFKLCASKAYLEKWGRPQNPAELSAHKQIRYRLPGTGQIPEWQLSNAGETYTVPSRPVLVFNNQDACRDAITAGLGIGFLEAAHYSVPVQQGVIEILLEGYRLLRDSAYHLYYPHREHLAPKVRVFVDFLIEQFARG